MRRAIDGEQVGAFSAGECSLAAIVDGVNAVIGTIRDRSSNHMSGLSFMPIGFRFVSAGLRFIASGFRFVPAGFGFMASGFRFVPAGFRFMTSGFRFVLAGFRFMTSGLRFILAGFRFMASGFRFIPVGFRCISEQRSIAPKMPRSKLFGIAPNCY
jgi:hypothetical protein